MSVAKRMIEDELGINLSSYQIWLDAKAAEKAAVATRRKIEDQMIEDFKVSNEFEGTQNFEPDGFKIKVTSRMNRKVDSDKIQAIAHEHGLIDHLPNLFRWKPELNMTAWKAADASITKPLLGGITTTPGRASFSITKTVEEL